VSHDAPPRPPGLTRVDGRWFHQDGEAVDTDTLARLKRLAIPPAWTHVWADPDPDAALQAVGVDAKGRTQYRYHPKTVADRARDKFEHVARFADALPRLRAAAETGLAAPGLGRDRVLAAAVRLLERGFFRVGNEEYARDNHTYGLTTLQRTQVRVHGDALAFDYTAKEHLHRVVEVRDPQAAAVVRALLRRDSHAKSTKLQVADLELDTRSHRVIRSEMPIELTSKEYAMLEYFMRHPGQVLSKQQILSAVWGYDFDPGTNVVEVYVGYLRRKLAGNGGPAPIETLRSVGYRLVDRE